MPADLDADIALKGRAFLCGEPVALWSQDAGSLAASQNVVSDAPEGVK
jgi:hypothetical protein